MSFRQFPFMQYTSRISNYILQVPIIFQNSFMYFNKLKRLQRIMMSCVKWRMHIHMTYISQRGAIQYKSWTQIHNVGPPTHLNLWVAMDVHQPKTHQSEGRMRMKWKWGPYIPTARGGGTIDWTWPFHTQPMDVTCPWWWGIDNQHINCSRAIA
jgi:hypothetical protein